MRFSRLTQIIVIAAVILLLAYDGIVFWFEGTEGTISHYLVVQSHQYLLIPFSFGLLIGHLYAQARPSQT